MTSSSIDPRTKQLVLQLLQTQPLPLTELLGALRAQELSASTIQDALAILLDTGVIEMGPDRRLHLAQVVA